MTSLVKLGKYIHTPDEKKRYTIDYSQWLDEGETIVSAESEVDNVTVVPIVVSGLITGPTYASFYVSGGEHEESYTIVIKVETSADQIKQDGILVRVKDFTP